MSRVQIRLGFPKRYHRGPSGFRVKSCFTVRIRVMIRVGLGLGSGLGLKLGFWSKNIKNPET